ncbi:MAG: sugar ABC transporter permease [Candidatus Izimaplasma sp.]|nr:sugar ABC transporter permease [Candidatus Izimaplasma bacterium]
MEKQYAKYGYIFITPFFLVFLIFSIYPIFYTLYLSFTDYNGFVDPIWIGLKNYKLVFGDAKFWKALTNTIRIWGVNIVLQLGLAFILVMIFSDLKYRIKGLKVFRIVFYLPNLIAAASVALIFVKLLNKDYGVVNTLLFRFNLITKTIPWLEKSMLAQLSVSNIQTWMWFGNSFILFMAAIQAVNKETIESAVIDGAGRLAIMRHIKLPLIKPILIYVAITGLIGGLQLFDIPLLITDGYGAPEGGLNTVILYLFNHAFKYGNFGYAAAIAYVLFVFILLISIIFLIIVNRSNIKEYLSLRRARKEAKVNG